VTCSFDNIGTYCLARNQHLCDNRRTKKEGGDGPLNSSFSLKTTYELPKISTLTTRPFKYSRVSCLTFFLYISKTPKYFNL